MYTLEINGRPLVVTNADEEDARALLESEEFKSDLQTLTSDGEPLWDGTSPMTIRSATDSEVESFEDALSDDDYEDEEGEEGGSEGEDEPIDIVFLVEVDDEDEQDDDTASA
jgi:hypothetical protein